MEWPQDSDGEDAEGLNVERIGRYGLSKLQQLIARALSALHVDEVPELRQDWEPERTVEVETEGTDEVPTADLEALMDDALVEKTREDLHKAMQAHITALGVSVVVTDWFAVADCVTDDDSRVLQFAVSDGMSAWRLRGLAYYSSGILERYTS